MLLVTPLQLLSRVQCLVCGASRKGPGIFILKPPQAIIPYVDVLSESAKAIGSVNTIIVKEEYVSAEEHVGDGEEEGGEDGFRRVIYGDNTDWKGIYNPLSRLLGSQRQAGDTCLILGAGGTARAAAFVVAQKLGSHLRVIP